MVLIGGVAYGFDLNMVPEVSSMMVQPMIVSSIQSREVSAIGRLLIMHYIQRSSIGTFLSALNLEVFLLGGVL